jgi:hypothetical protein
MRVLLCLLSLLVGLSLAVNSTYSATPGISIRPPIPNTKLILDASHLILDLDAGLFYLNVSTYFSDGTTTGDLPVATATGSVMFQEGGIILFAPTSCIQARSYPSLCIDAIPYLLQLINGPFIFGASPPSGNVEELVIQSTTSNPNPLGPINFLGATQPIIYTCIGTCAELQSQVPTQQNVSYTVCRSLLLLLPKSGGQDMAKCNLGIKRDDSKDRVSIR